MDEPALFDGVIDLAQKRIDLHDDADYPYNELFGYRHGRQILRIQLRPFDDDTKVATFAEVTAVIPLGELDAVVWAADVFGHFGSDNADPNSTTNPNSPNYIRPSQHPERQEALMVQHYAPGGPTRIALCAYHRDVFGARVFAPPRVVVIDDVGTSTEGVMVTMVRDMFRVQTSGRMSLTEYLTALDAAGHTVAYDENGLD